MVNLVLGISLTLNVIVVIGIFIYIKIKVSGIKKIQKDFDNIFCTDKEYNDMLDRLWFYEYFKVKI